MQAQPITATTFPAFLGSRERNIAFSLDFSSWMGTGETVTSATAQVLASPTNGPPFYVTDVTLLVVPSATTSPQALATPLLNVAIVALGPGGVPNTTYTVTIVATTSGGRLVESQLPPITCPANS